MTINPAAGDGLEACSAAAGRLRHHRTLPLPRRGEDRLGRNRGAGPRKHPQRRGLPAHPRTRQPLPLLARHRRTGRAPEAAGRDQGQPADRAGDHGLQRHPLPGRQPAGALRELRLHVFGGPRAPLATPGQLRDLPDPLLLRPLVGQSRRSEGDSADADHHAAAARAGSAPELAAGTQGSTAGAFSPFTLTLTRQDGEANPQDPRPAPAPGPAGQARRRAALPRRRRRHRRLPGGPRSARSPPPRASAARPSGSPSPARPHRRLPRRPLQRRPLLDRRRGPRPGRALRPRHRRQPPAIYVDPETALATITTDPLPQILEGVPVPYRTIHVTVDRPEFTLNPTSCEPKPITATVTAANGAAAEPTGRLPGHQLRQARLQPRS